ncbi:MAG TPA: hypothetical protein VII11_08645 [Bacteroidota bacterium]
MVELEGLKTDSYPSNRFRERPTLPITGTRTVLLKYSYTFVL